MKNLNIPQPPPLPSYIGGYAPWAAIIAVVAWLLVYAVTWCWNNCLVTLFHLPTFTMWNSLALLGVLGFVWGFVWLVGSSLTKEPA